MLNLDYPQLSHSSNCFVTVDMLRLNIILYCFLLTAGQAPDLEFICPEVPHTKPVNISHLEFYAWARTQSSISALYRDCANITIHESSKIMRFMRKADDREANIPEHNEEAMQFEWKIYLEADWIAIY